MTTRYIILSMAMLCPTFLIGAGLQQSVQKLETKLSSLAQTLNQLSGTLVKTKKSLAQKKIQQATELQQDIVRAQQQVLQEKNPQELNLIKLEKLANLEQEVESYKEQLKQAEQEKQARLEQEKAAATAYFEKLEEEKQQALEREQFMLKKTEAPQVPTFQTLYTEGIQTGISYIYNLFKISEEKFKDAIRNDNNVELEILIKKYGEIFKNKKNEFFLFACQYGRENVILKNLVVKEGYTPTFFGGKLRIDINAQDKEQNTGLHWICHRGNFKIVEQLLYWNIEVNTTNNKGQTPLQIACYQAIMEDVPSKQAKRFGIVEALLGKKATFSPTDKVVKSMFFYAAKKNKENLVKTFIKANAELLKEKNEFDNGNTLIHTLCEQANDTLYDYIAYHYSKPFNESLKIINNLRQDALHIVCAASKKDPEKNYTYFVNTLIKDKGFSPTTPTLHNEINPDLTGWTALHYACHAGNLKIVQMLVEEYFYEEVETDEEGYSIYKKKISIDIQDAKGRTPLHLACKAGHIEVVKYLANSYGRPSKEEKIINADVSLRDAQGNTPLHYACMVKGTDPNAQEALEIVKHILLIGITFLNLFITEKNNGELTPLYFAIKAENFNIINELTRDRGSYQYDQFQDTTIKLILKKLEDGSLQKNELPIKIQEALTEYEKATQIITKAKANLQEEILNLNNAIIEKNLVNLTLIAKRTHDIKKSLDNISTYKLPGFEEEIKKINNVAKRLSIKINDALLKEQQKEEIPLKKVIETNKTQIKKIIKEFVLAAKIKDVKKLRDLNNMILKIKIETKKIKQQSLQEEVTKITNVAQKLSEKIQENIQDIELEKLTIPQASQEYQEKQAVLQ